MRWDGLARLRGIDCCSEPGRLPGNPQAPGTEAEMARVLYTAQATVTGGRGVVGRRERVEVGDVSIDSRVSLFPAEDRSFKLAVELDVTLPQVQDPEQATRIVAAAHQVCPYSNATRGNIDVTLTANGHAVG